VLCLRLSLGLGLGLGLRVKAIELGQCLGHAAEGGASFLLLFIICRFYF
jgi:hypothetical protein